LINKDSFSVQKVFLLCEKPYFIFKKLSGNIKKQVFNHLNFKKKMRNKYVTGSKQLLNKNSRLFQLSDQQR